MRGRGGGGVAVLGLAFVLCILSLYLPSIWADRIFSSSTGVSFGRSSREPKYKIEFHSLESPFQPDDNQESIIMSNSEGKQYLCYLPVVEESKSPKPVTQHNTSGIIVGTNSAIKLKSPDELLEVLKDRGCLYRHEGWWSYEFCYHKKVRQLHIEEEKIAQEFVLGEFDPEVTAAYNQNQTDVSTLKDPRSKDASQRYHAHIYNNGTVCDLTNEPRETEVRFICADSPIMITSFKEISTCKYAITIQGPMLCKHPMFQQERPTWHSIRCNELPAAGGGSDKNQEGSKQITVVSEDAGRFAT